jgi:hypothetical protein
MIIPIDLDLKKISKLEKIIPGRYPEKLFLFIESLSATGGLNLFLAPFNRGLPC